MLTIKLADSKQNIKQLNGWSYNDEVLHRQLSWKEKEAVNILMIEELIFLLPRERSSFKELVKKVSNNSNVIKLSNEAIARRQHYFLIKEAREKAAKGEADIIEKTVLPKKTIYKKKFITESALKELAKSQYKNNKIK